MNRLIFIAITVLFFTACNSRKSEEKAADIKITLIKNLIAENKLNEAKTEIDSIHALYPRLINKRKEAVALKDTIILRESNRTLKYCNQILPELFNTVKEFEKEFIFKKNEKYEETGKYSYKTQLTEQNTNKTYLSCDIDENYDIYLTSKYVGSKLNHFAIKVQANAGLTAQTDSSNHKAGVFHTYNIDSNNVEQLTFRNESDGGIIKFIHEYQRMDIKITLIGNKKYNYTLSNPNKEVISKTYAFANALRLLKKTENESRIAQQRIGKIKLLYNINN